MTRSFKRIAPALTLAIVVALGSAQASAGGRYHHRHHGHGGHHYAYLALPLVALFAWAAHSSSHQAAHYPRRRYASRPCHFVIKDTYNQDGDAVRLGGTMCYDSYGNAYIAAGSRHFVGFLD